MADIRAQIDALRARALHPSTPEEEARTSAVIALKLEQKYGITGSAPALDFEDELQLAVLEALRERAVAGGVARAKKLSSKRKAVIAQQAAETRWAHLTGDADEQARRAKRAAQARARRAMQR